MKGFNKTISANVQDRLGFELGVRMVVLNEGAGAWGAWVVDIKKKGDEQWDSITPFICQGAQFSELKDAKEWVTKAAELAVSRIQSSPENKAMGSAKQKPSDVAKELGAVSLANVVKVTGVNLNTLINWHKDKPRLFKAVCLGVANTKEKEAVI